MRNLTESFVLIGNNSNFQELIGQTVDKRQISLAVKAKRKLDTYAHYDAVKGIDASGLLDSITLNDQGAYVASELEIDLDLEPTASEKLGALSELINSVKDGKYTREPGSWNEDIRAVSRYKLGQVFPLSIIGSCIPFRHFTNK